MKPVAPVTSTVRVAEWSKPDVFIVFSCFWHFRKN
jgi:hypothetical protein